MRSLQSYFFEAFLRLVGVIIRPTTSVASLRKSMGSMTFAALPRGVRIESAISGGVPAEWFIPRLETPGRAILYLHGSGYVIAAPRVHRPLIARLAHACGARALMISYRLAPEHPYPAAVDDALAAYRWLISEGYAPASIALAGDSAGGGLALALCMALRDSGEPLPAAVATVSAWTDLLCEGESMVTRKRADPFGSQEEVTLRLCARLYAGDCDPRQSHISPLYGDFKGLPPLLLLAGENEMILSDTTRAAERARAAGCDVRLEVWPGMFHVWPTFAPYLPEANTAIAHVAEFIRSKLPS